MRRESALVAMFLFVEKVLPFLAACILYVSFSYLSGKISFAFVFVSILAFYVSILIPVALLGGRVMVLGTRLANSRPLKSAWLTLHLAHSSASWGKQLQADQIVKQVLSRVADYGGVNELTPWQITVLVVTMLRFRKPIQSSRPKNNDRKEDWRLAMEMISKSAKTPKILRNYVASRALSSG